MDKQNFYDLNFDQLKNFLIEKVNVDEDQIEPFLPYIYKKLNLTI